MSLDKAIEHGKEHRKEYHGAKAIDAQCRCHGTCGYCQGNRQYKNVKRIIDQEEQIKEWENSSDASQEWKESGDI